MSNTKPRKVLASRKLEDYKVKKELLTKLQRAIALRDYMKLGGRTPPNEIRLFRQDYYDIDRLVLAQSDEKLHVTDITFAGLSIIAEGQAPKSFALEAS